MAKSNFVGGSRFDHIPAQLCYYCNLRSTKKSTLFERAGLSVSQGYRLMRHPGEIRLSTYDAFCDCLNIPLSERTLYR